ncbi:STAS domain-containing protein [Lentzea guizhouensis]|nr:STAS domain-containing protein [Lentzea guizhouensis]
MHNSTGSVFAPTLFQDEIAIVTVKGEIDTVADEILLAEAVDVLTRPPAGLVIDLQAVTFFGSSGINFLVAVRHQAQSRGVPFAVVAAQNAVVRPLQLTCVDRIIAPYPSLSDALAAVRATGSPPAQRKQLTRPAASATPSE